MAAAKRTLRASQIQSCVYSGVMERKRLYILSHGLHLVKRPHLLLLSLGNASGGFSSLQIDDHVGNILANSRAYPSTLTKAGY
jgi:hypothetical protein